MATWKIFSIGKANQRIEELEAENSQLKAQLKAAEDSVPESVTALQGELEKANAANAATQADLATAKQTIGTLTTEKTALAGQVDTLTKQLAAKDAEVETKVAAKVATITASAGAPPPPAIPAAAKETPKTVTGLERVRAAAAADIKAAIQAGQYTPKN